MIKSSTFRKGQKSSFISSVRLYTQAVHDHLKTLLRISDLDFAFLWQINSSGNPKIPPNFPQVAVLTGAA